MTFKNWLRRIFGQAPDSEPESYVVTGEWEQHPCILPIDVGMTHIGLTWACAECGRRFRLLSIQYSVSAYMPDRHTWVEVEAVEELTDAAINSFFDEEGAT